MNNLAVIPARGGSKRIHKKNIRFFLGKPIIAYSIEAAIQSKLFKEVMVATDDDEIAEIAQDHGASIPFKRSAQNADDYATLNDIFNEVKTYYQKKSEVYEHFCLILPTAPLITTELLMNGYEFFKSSQFDSVRPIVRFGYPIQRAVKLESGKISFFDPAFSKTRSQDLEPAFHDAGMFYYIHKDSDLSGNNKGAFEIDEIYAQDIDTENDWKLAELKYHYLFHRSP